MKDTPYKILFVDELAIREVLTECEILYINARQRKAFGGNEENGNGEV